MKIFKHNLIILSLLIIFCQGYAKEANQWINLKKKSINDVGLNPNSAQNLKITQDDSEIACVRKILLFSNYAWKKPSPEKMNATVKLCLDAQKQYPGSAAIASYLAMYQYLARELDADLCIRILLPFVQENSDCPLVSFSMWYIMESLQRNYRNATPLDGENKISRLLGCKGKPVEAERRLRLLEQYWLSKNQPNIGSEELKEKIAEAERTFSDLQKKQEAVAVWQLFINNSITEEITSHGYNVEVQTMDKYLKEQNELRNKRESERAQSLKSDFENAIKNLDDFYILPNATEKITEIFARLRMFTRKLNDFKDIPNYTKLQETFKDSDEAEILNVAYKIYVRDEYADSLEMVSDLLKKDMDVRLLLMKLYCQQKLGQSDAEILTTLNEILKIEPMRMQIIMIKGALEAKLEAEKDTKR